MPYDPIGSPVFYMTVAGVRMPGITEVDGNDGGPRKFDEQVGYGVSFATLKYIGRGLPKFDSITSLYTREEHIAWEEVFANHILNSPKIVNGRAQGLDVWHPKLSLYQIKAAVVLNFALPKQTEEGVTQILINWQAWRPQPKFQLAKVETSQATITDPYDRINQAKVDRLNELARG